MPSLPLTVVRQLHPDTYSYLDRVRQAGGEIANHQIDPLNRFVFGHYDTGLRNRNGSGHLVTYCLPLHLTRSIAGCNVPLWAPSGVGNATLNNFVAGDWSINGLKADGSTKFVDTLFVPSTHMAGDANASFLAWETEKADTPAASGYSVMAAYSGTSNINRLLIAPNTGTTAYTVRLFWSSTDGIERACDVKTSGYSTGIMQVSALPGQFYAQLNNTLITNRTSGVTLTHARPTRPVYLFARSDNDPGITGLYGNSRIKAVALGDGLTVAQMQLQYSLFVEQLS